LENSAPSQQAGFETTIDKRSWTDIGGYAQLKKKLQRAVLLPISNPETYKRLGIPPPSGILLFGPSGMVKTAIMISKAIKKSNAYLLQDVENHYLCRHLHLNPP
jgi:SpoVK/Ycf46/Vps4 family AAA+-type ATPase